MPPAGDLKDQIADAGTPTLSLMPVRSQVGGAGLCWCRQPTGDAVASISTFRCRSAGQEPGVESLLQVIRAGLGRGAERQPGLGARLLASVGVGGREHLGRVRAQARALLAGDDGGSCRASRSSAARAEAGA
jgi:hypothetical protein